MARAAVLMAVALAVAAAATSPAAASETMGQTVSAKLHSLADAAKAKVAALLPHKGGGDGGGPAGGGGGGGLGTGQLLTMPLDWDDLDNRLTFNFSVQIKDDAKSAGAYYSGIARADFGSAEGLVYAVDGCKVPDCQNCSPGFDFPGKPGVCLCAPADRLPPFLCPSTGEQPPAGSFENDTYSKREGYHCPATGVTSIKLGPAGRKTDFDLPDLRRTKLETRMYTTKYCPAGASSRVSANSGFAHGSPLLEGLYAALDSRVTVLDVPGYLLGAGKPSIVVGGGPPDNYLIRTRVRSLADHDGRSVRITRINGEVPPGGYEDVTVDTGNSAFVTYCSGPDCELRDGPSLFKYHDFPLTIEFEGGQSVRIDDSGTLATGHTPGIFGGAV